MDNVRKYCSKALMIRDGEIIAIGSPEDVANEYSLENLGVSQPVNSKSKRKESIIRDLGVEIISPKQIDQTQKAKIRVSYKATKPSELFAIVTLQDIKRNVSTVDSLSKIKKNKSGEEITHLVEIDLSETNNAEFRVRAQIRNKNKETLAWIPEDQAPLFLFKRTDYAKRPKASDYGVLLDKAEWSPRR
jgi:ABC-2 type transport system ATP-binding protein